MDFPHDLARLLGGRQLDSISLGESGAGVWRCTMPAHAAWYLKTAPIDAQLGLDREAACMDWMRESGLPVHAVLDYRRWSDVEYLLSEAGVGVPASDSEWRETPVSVASALGRVLARLHATEVSACPFDRRVGRRLDEARDRNAAGLVREDDFGAARRGRTAADLFTELLGMVPAQQDLVFVHGDFCLPNVLLAPLDGALHVTGLVDCGRAGVGDRHQDLALGGWQRGYHGRTSPSGRHAPR